MKFEQGALYVDNYDKIWQYIGTTTGNTHHITLKLGCVGYSTTCDHHGEFYYEGQGLNKLVRKVPNLIHGKTYLDNNNQPWKYRGVGAIQRGNRDTSPYKYISPNCMVSASGLLYGYDRTKWNEIYLTEREYFPINLKDVFVDSNGHLWTAKQEYANGYSCSINSPVKDYPPVAVLHFDGKLRTVYNGCAYELPVIKHSSSKEPVSFDSIDSIVDEVISRLKEDYELVPKKKIENNKFYHYPMLAKMKTDAVELIGLLKEPKKGESEVIILSSIGSVYQVGQIMQTNSNLWVPLEETFHMRNP